MRPGTVPFLIGVALLAPASALAQAAMPRTQAPGYFRMKLGDFEVTALNDAVVPYPLGTVLPTAGPNRIAKALYDAGLTDPVGMSYNAFLINTGTKVVLIDVGTGDKLGDVEGFRGAGRLLGNLRAAGYQPEQIDEIYITHLGPDHVGALTLGSKPTFPNARLRAAKREVAVFLEPGRLEPFDSAWRAFRAGLFQPYIDRGKFAAFESDTVLVPGVRALATPGHTPGHTSYLVESKGQTLLVLGDLVHAAALQFAEPSLPAAFDRDRGQGAAQRARIFQLAAERNYWVAGSHLSFPGIGHLRGQQGTFRWVPVEYTIP